MAEAQLTWSEAEKEDKADRLRDKEVKEQYVLKNSDDSFWEPGHELDWTVARSKLSMKWVWQSGGKPEWWRAVIDHILRDEGSYGRADL